MKDRIDLPHGAYFGALARETSQQGSAWRSALAGLAAMRLLDKWAEGRPLPSAGLRALERAVKMMDIDAPERPPLWRLHQALVIESGGRVLGGEPVVLVSIREYVEALWHTAEWALAIDACRTVINHASAPAERAMVPMFYHHLGNCLGMRGQSGAAFEAFETGRAMCGRGDVESDLRLRISEARLEAQTGSTAGAERILNEVIADASQAGIPNAVARAVHELGVIAYHNDDTRGALSLFLTALKAYGNQAGSDRVMADVALAMLDLGMQEEARDMLVALEAYSSEREQRWIATLNLMRIATFEGDEQRFAECRRKLRDIRLPVRLQAHCECLVAEGYCRFGQARPAREALLRARAIVQRYALHELDVHLEDVRRQLDHMRQTGASECPNRIQ